MKSKLLIPVTTLAVTVLIVMAALHRFHSRFQVKLRPQSLWATN